MQSLSFANPNASLSIDWAGEDWLLLPGRAVWWPRKGALIAADLHLGKAASFRAAGVPVPEVIEADLARLTELLGLTGAERLIVVGDLIHAAAGRTQSVINAVTAWRRSHSHIEITLIRGNHDDHAGDPPGAWDVQAVDGPWRADPGDSICFAHDPDQPRDLSGACIGGHLHPAIVMADDFTSLRAPCFWIRRAGKGTMVLPAFGRFTGARAISPRVGDRVFPVGNGEIAELALGQSVSLSPPASGAAVVCRRSTSAAGSGRTPPAPRA